MLEEGWTYTVNFDVWPSQESYDLVAALNNCILNYGDDYHYTDSNGQAQTITAEVYQSQIPNTRPYALKTNTYANVTYQQMTAVTDAEGNTTYKPYGDPKTIPIDYTGNMGLVSQLMPVKKTFAHTINAQDPYTQIRFYLLRDGQYYQSDGTSSDTLVTEGEVHTYSMDLSDANHWEDSMYISPGLIVENKMPPAYSAGKLNISISIH